jgi:hypothetical protein
MEQTFCLLFIRAFVAEWLRRYVQVVVNFVGAGSSPVECITFFRSVPVAQWIAHQTSDLGVGGSSPPRDSLFCGVILFSIGNHCSR